MSARKAKIIAQEKPAIKRAAIYTRVSTEDQANEGYGLEVQLERTRAQIVVKGWQNAGEYQDAGISGTKGATHRPGLSAMIDAAKAGEIDAVIVLALDRLGRNTRLVLELVETFAGLDVDIVSCKESLDTSTPQGRFVLTMFAALAELERDTIVARTTDGRNERGRVDGEKGGRVPMGYHRQADGTIAINPEWAAIVRRVYSLRALKLSMQAIAEQINELGYSTPRGGKWYASVVKVVLDNEPIYQGGRRGESSIQWPAILE